MNSSALSFLALAAIAATTLAGSSASAQTLAQTRSAEAVRSDFMQAGFQADTPTTWWTNGVTTFTVRDTRSDRIVMVMVYPSIGSAQTERQRAASHDASGSVANTHPRLVPAYGPSEWRGNVALVQSSMFELGRLSDSSYADDSAVIIRTDADVLAMRPVTAAPIVDADLVAIISEEIVNL
jgi:hypothetical protein